MLLSCGLSFHNSRRSLLCKRDDEVAFILLVACAAYKVSLFHFSQEFTQGCGPDVERFQQVALVYGRLTLKDCEDAQLRMFGVSLMVMRPYYEFCGFVKQKRQ